MTVDNPHVIDALAYDPHKDQVSFVLVEYRDWGERGNLLPDLQAKLNTYLAYALDGQYAEEYPDYQGKPLCFDLRVGYPLGPLELEFLRIIRKEHLDPLGIAMTWKLHDFDTGQPNSHEM